MAYSIEGVLGSAAALAPSARLTHARVIALREGVHLLPMTDDLYAELNQPGTERSLPVFAKLPRGFENTLAQWSQAGPVAYVEADIFAGIGSQVAVVWDRGEIVLGPVDDTDHAPTYGNPWPISRALRRLGVVVSGGGWDEFDAVGLGRWRQTKRWVADTEP